MHCMHVDTTVVDSYETKTGHKILVSECDFCGRVFKLVDHRTVSNFPTMAYYAHLSTR